jgi:polyketide-type polyunsaturated fatty acid synthase PfaA
MPMPISSKHIDTLMQLENEVKQLESILVKRIWSKNHHMSPNISAETNLTNTQLQQTPIAIIGMASIFPQSRNLQEYWEAIVKKKDCITDVPPSRWNVDDYYDSNPQAPDKTYCKRGGFIPEIDFNPMEFGLPPNQLEVTDISQLLALVVAKEALKDAGYEDKPFDCEHTGVVLGVALARQLTMPLAARLQYPVWEKALKSSGISAADTEKIIHKIKNSYINWEPNAFPGMLANVVAGRIANRFDLGGMNCIVDAACASSFGALSMAISELTSGRANMMLTGGVDTDNSIVAYMCFSKTPAVSCSETTKPFDADSDGMMLGEGVGMLVLKRLSDAEQDGDRIYGVIKGVGTSSDGRHKSIYAPRPEGQMRALRRAYQEAGFEPNTVGVIEAHGTGTMAGDPAEFTALKAVFCENNYSERAIALGSVKSQIGHTKAAAGAASLIKMALALHHKILPPTINVTKPHPKLEIENSPFYLNTETRPWLKSSEAAPRRAGVSSFGFGGTNYHLVLEEYQAQQQSSYRLHQTPQAILIEASTTQELKQKCQDIWQQLQSTTGKSYFTELIRDSDTKEVSLDAARLGFVAASVTEASNKLQKAIDCLKNQGQDWSHPLGIFYRQTGLETKGKVVALFSGQGSQYLEMGRELAMNFPCWQKTYSQIDSLFERDNLTAISKLVFPPPVFEETEKQKQVEALQQTEIAQSAIAAFSVSLYKILQETGFQPDFVAGHSFGELTALWAAGVLSDEDYFFLVKERGKAMATPAGALEAGAMLAVQGDVTKTQAIIKKFPQVAVANFNSPQQVVLAGDKTEIVRAQAILQEQGYSAVILPVSAAFHTEKVAHAQQPFAEAVEKVTFKNPQIPVFTNVSGNPYPSEPQDCQKILKQQLLSSVLFQEQIENIYATGGTCFVEFGPRSILTHLVKEILGERPHLAVALNASRQKDSDRQLKEAVIQLRVAGLNLSNLDPYQILPTQPESKHPLSVSLSSVNYVSEKTKQAFKKVLEKEDKMTGMSNAVGIAIQEKVDSNLKHSNLDLISSTYIGNTNNHLDNGNGNQKNVITIKTNQTRQFEQLTTMNDEPMIPASTNNPELGLTKIVLERILGSLESSLSQFHQHQQETLEVHKQYLNYQSQYAQTFFQLMQQQNQLWANVQTVPQETQIKLAVLESAERSLMKFQEHQANTLGVHEQYLNHQAQYAKNFFLLTQQSYSQFLKGDLEMIEKREEGRRNREQGIVEFVNGNGHKAELELVTEAVNGNGHYSELKSESQLVVEESPTIAAITVPVPEIDVAILSETLLNVVSEKTGYPPEMLELDMDLEADLGIDSIKRVEILGALQEQIPDLPQPNLEDLGDLRTLNQIIEYLRSFNSSNNSSTEKTTNLIEPVEVVETNIQSESTEATLEVTLLRIISEKTGYPVSTLNREMSMKADLGIDSVKKQAIFDSIQQKMPDLWLSNREKLEIEALDTLAQILDYLNHQSQKKTSLSLNPL